MEEVLPGQPQVDANTMALYHFDSSNGSQVIDATGRYAGTLQGNASIASQGVYAGALQTFPGGSVLTGYMGAMSQGTIEGFFDFKSACTSMVSTFPFITAGPDPANGQLTLLLGQDMYARNYNTLSFSIWAEKGWQSITSDINTCRYLGNNIDSELPWPYEGWRYHHVAATWGPRGMELWVDGVLHGSGSDPYHRYYCNPQQQSYGPNFYMKSDTDPTKYQTWSGYPLCATPFISSQAPGTFTGGLWANSRFQIGGCIPISGWECFNGRIDEVRISNVQRTFDWKKTDPTSTPTLVPTPVQIGAYGIDPFTASLYRFDSVDGSGVYDEVLHRYTYATHTLTLVPGRYNSALALDGNTGLEVRDLSSPPDGTVEAWINLNTAPNSFTIIGGKQYWNAPGPAMYLGRSDRVGQNLIFAMWDSKGGSWIVADSGINAEALVGSWHHVAGTWGEAGLQVWVDGQLRQSVSFSGAQPVPIFSYLIGCDPSGQCISGAIDEFRLSTIQRYFAALPTPTPTLTPTPVYSSGPGVVAHATTQSASPGLSPDDQTRLNGVINSNHRGSNQPSGSSPAGQLAMAPYAPTPGPTLLAAIAAETPAPPRDSPKVVASPPVKTSQLSADQPLSLDSNTVALYRLNSQYGITLSDATGNYPAILFGDATIKSIGADRPALTLNGSLSYAQVNHFSSPQNGTVEVWASLDSTMGQMTIVTTRQNSLPRFLLGVRPDEGMDLGFGLYNSGWQWADSGVTPKMLGSGWHHIAGTYGPRGIEIWIDGVLRGVNANANGLLPKGDDTLLIGWSPGSAGMTGRISQIRISDSQRSY